MWCLRSAFVRQTYDAQTAVIAGRTLKLDGEFSTVQFTIKFDVFARTKDIRRCIDRFDGRRFVFEVREGLFG